MGTNLRLVVCAALVLLPTTSAWGFEHPNQSRGLTPGTAILDIDRISAFNGALGVSIPIGQHYPVSESLSYGLTLSYNSNVWDFESVEPYTVAEPQARVNAGLGWILTMGKLYKPNNPPWNGTNNWAYVGPDGGTHFFNQNPRAGESDGNTNYSYTRDGSYLRMVKITPTWRHIEYSDGTVHQFGKTGPNWNLEWIKDAYGNWVKITYDTVGDDTTWTIEDIHGRTHVVYLTDTGSMFGPLVQRVELEAFGGQTAIYTLNYNTTRKVNRSCKDDFPWNDPDRIKVPHLVQVQTPIGDYTFIDPDDPEQHPWYYNTCEGGIDDVPGALRGIVLPTGGRIVYEFQEYDFPPGGQQHTYDSTAGVETRTLLHKDGSPLGTWSYKTTMVDDPGGGADPEMTTEVIAPSGACIKNYFSGRYWLTSSPEKLGWEYGLPFVFRQDHNNEDRYLSQEVYALGSSCVGSPIQTVYQRYSHDPLPSEGVGESNKPWWYSSNRRPSARRVVFHHDGDRWIDEESWDPDGVGNYRTTFQSGNLSPGPNQYRTVTVDHNPQRGTCCGAGYNPVAVTDPWIHNRYDSVEISEPGATGETLSRKEFKFNALGRLENVRVLASGDQRSVADLVSAFTVDPVTGERQEMKLYGGAGSGVDAQAGWTLSGPETARTTYTYQHGVLASKQVYDSSGVPLPFLSTDRDIDLSTGLAAASRTPAGFQTDYTYDAARRPKTIVPQQGARTTYTNTAADAQNPAKGRVSVISVGVGLGNGTVHSQREVIFDDFGRPVMERTNTPDHGWVETTVGLDAEGLLEYVTVPNDPLHQVTIESRDALGRPLRMRPPDGPSHDIVARYWGGRVVEKDLSRAATAGTESVVTRRESYDTFGQLVELLEDWNGLDATYARKTTYDYDVNGNLVGLHVTDPGTLTTQSRAYVYDNRGFLLSETHPELGPTGNGTTLFVEHTLGGKPGRILDGDRDLGYTYDALGRLLQVVDKTEGDRLVQEILYDQGSGYGAARAWQAVQHNYLDLPWTESPEDHVEVRETFAYDGLGGRLSSVMTAVGNYGFEYSQTYDDAGQIVQIDYPECTHPGCSPRPFSVTRDYELGYLKAIPSWASSITYKPNGLIAQLVRANNVVDVVTPDPSGLPRALRVETQGVTGGLNWDSGAYGWDGGGSVKQIGVESFLYDRLGRLVQGTLTGSTQDYGYDGFGNLTAYSLTESGGSPVNITFPADLATNRLTAATYDANGNVLAVQASGFAWDALGRMVSSTSPGETMQHVYTADGERVWTITQAGGSIEQRFSLRGVGARVLREIDLTGAGAGTTWSWARDYVHRQGGALLASIDASGERHYHLDHLGTPRQITDENAGQVSRHDYYPYGIERTPGVLFDEAMRFTGHERDPGDGGDGNVRDYMHARHYSPFMGRFLSVDSHRGSTKYPGSLNRFAYTGGNPVTLNDPDGRCAGTGVCGLVGGIAMGSLSGVGKVLNVFGAEDMGNGFYLASGIMGSVLGVAEAVGPNPASWAGGGAMVVGGVVQASDAFSSALDKARANSRQKKKGGVPQVVAPVQHPKTCEETPECVEPPVTSPPPPPVCQGEECTTPTDPTEPVDPTDRPGGGGKLDGPEHIDACTENSVLCGDGDAGESTTCPTCLDGNGWPTGESVTITGGDYGLLGSSNGVACYSHNETGSVVCIQYY